MNRLTFRIAIFTALLSLTSCSLLLKSRRSWHLILQSEPHGLSQEVLNKTIAVIKQRLTLAGVRNSEVHAEGSQIILNLPSVVDRERIKAFITNEGRLEFTHLISAPYPTPAQTYAEADALASFEQERFD